MTVHELKTWPEPFTAILEGRKTHEIRRSDRPFAVGDVLHLREWNPDPTTDETQHGYTGRYIDVEVTYLTSGGSWGLPDDLCVMSIDASIPVDDADDHDCDDEDCQRCHHVGGMT